MLDTPIQLPDPAELASAKALVRRYLSSPHRLVAVAPDAEWHVSHPVNVVFGRDAIESQWVEPLNRAFAKLERRVEIFLGGGFDGRFCGGAGVWISCHGNYVGEWVAPLFGKAPSQRLSTLRFGEFYRVVGEEIVEARILVDWVDLCRQAGRRLLPFSPGIEGWVPGSALSDGLQYDAQPASKTLACIARVQAMIEALGRFDGVNLDTMGMHEHWSPTMMWYGPCGIGTTRTVKGFQDHHQRPFLHAFPDRKGGFHRSRIAEGHYMASTGWPSVSATHAGEYLGAPASHVKIGMRVMDWWRVSDTTIEENWVLIDLPHLFLQMGVDVFSSSR